MKKFFRKLFSPLIITAIISLIEIGVVVTALFLLSTYLDSLSEKDVLIYLLARAVAIIVFLIIVNKRENPEYKIPWLALMFILPVWTITFYLIFARVKLRKRDRNV